MDGFFRLYWKLVSVDKADSEGITALMKAAIRDNTKYLNFLISAGCNVNLRDNKGRTALMYSVNEKSSECLIALIQANADINAQDNEGRTALMYATKIRCYSGWIRNLLEAGADVNLRDKRGRTALMLAAGGLTHNLSKCVNNMDFFIERRCGFRKRYDREDDIIPLLTGAVADIDSTDNEGMTALMMAAGKGTEDIVDLLLRKGANVNLEDSTGQSALVHALKMHNFSNATWLVEKEAVPLLRKEHCSVVEQWALSWINFSSHKRLLARLCLCNGVVPHCNKGKGLIRIALVKGELNTVKYLISNCYVNAMDMADLRDSVFQNKLGQVEQSFVSDILSNPWPLVKLAFISVSSLLGPSPGREERIRQTGLAPRIQECLMFDRPLALLPIHHWGDIPLCFNPMEYEKLPAPYPLLYNWPVGRRLAECKCEDCEDTGLNFI